MFPLLLPPLGPGQRGERRGRVEGGQGPDQVSQREEQVVRGRVVGRARLELRPGAEVPPGALVGLEHLAQRGAGGGGGRCGCQRGAKAARRLGGSASQLVWGEALTCGFGAPGGSWAAMKMVT